MSRTHATRPWSDSSLSTLVAGVVAMLTGYTSTMVLMVQAGRAAGLSAGQISSWLWALSIGMALGTFCLSWRYRTPIIIVWSTPGAALLIGALPGIDYADALGAFIFSGALVLLCGLTGSFERLVRLVPGPLAAALLAGILFHIGVQIGGAANHQPALVIAMFLTYLVCRRLSPRYAILFTLIVGVLLAQLSGLLDFSHVELALAVPQWTTPSFSLATCISLGLPLFVVAMASQNMPGVAILRADGYPVAASPIISTTGVLSMLFAPFGAHGLTLAAISAAICTGPQAHEDPARRYTAGLWNGLACALVGTFGATLAALLVAFPAELVLTVAALALFTSIVSGLNNAVSDPRYREAAIMTFLITASDLTLFSIGSAFWGVIAGALTHFLIERRRGG